jgi:subtilisin-like proprotein convertase family protein
MVEVLSAGNYGRNGYGTLGNGATAKNVITVGAAESVRASGTDGCGVSNAGADSARDIPDFSSRGPTNDGRLKPDVVAPGTHITGAAPQHAGYAALTVCNKFLAGTAWYSVASGTSQAAPHVSGAAALVRRWHQRVHGAAPSPALTKALLVNTATDLGGGQNGKGDTIAAGPNHDQGWGRVNLGTVFDDTARDLRDQLDTLTASGDRRVRSYAVDNPAAPVKVTLAWTDAPGTSTANPVVNDLDLVVDAGGRTYKGNVFDGAVSRTGGSADPRNNLESVHLPAGTTGKFAVKVVATGIAGDGLPGNADATDQDYALVVSNAEPAPSAVLSHDATTLDTSIGAGGDGDGALEPGETFALDERLANAGDAGAATVRGTLTGASLAITQGSAPWLDLAAGDTGTNLIRYTGALASDAACGADVPATLSLTTAGGPHTVPLTLPTGVAGPPVALTRTHQPRLAIPDDDLAGVTSTIEVTTAGLIKDLDVRIADMDHPWVGDLRIDLTGPDGTTVTLVNQPGGPENLGDDFVDTVFDDEATAGIARQAPYTGRFRPQNDQLSRFDGKQQQGVWTLRVRDLVDLGTGTLGGWGTATSPATCSVATVTRIDSGPAGSSTDADFAFGSDFAGARFECSLDGDDFVPCTSPTSYAGLLEGAHEFEVRAVVGPQQQVDPTPARHTWTIDLPPETGITAGPSGRVASAAASFRFGAPGATFECSLDGAAFAACSSPHAYDGLSDGEHSFRVRARDGGGADPTPASRDWTVDTTAPAPTIATPINGTTISGTAGTAPGDSPTVTVIVSDRTYTTARDAAGGWSVDLMPALDPGGYIVRVEQSDDAVPANVGSAEAAFVIAPDPVVVPHGPPAEPPVPSAPASPADAPTFLLATTRGKSLTVLAACASACTVKAGRRTVSLPGAGTAVLRLKGRKLRVKLTAGPSVLTLSRRPSRRLRLWAMATEPCTLTVTAGASTSAQAVAGPDAPTRVDLRVAKSVRRVQLAAGTRTATLTLR